MVGNAFRTKETAAVLCDEDVVLNADAAKVLVSLKLIEIDELLAMSAGRRLASAGRFTIWSEIISARSSRTNLTRFRAIRVSASSATQIRSLSS